MVKGKRVGGNPRSYTRDVFWSFSMFARIFNRGYIGLVADNCDIC